jgi:hypothetical protein
MEYIVGALIAIASTLVLRFFLKQDFEKLEGLRIKTSQSYTFSISNGMMYQAEKPPSKMTQAKKIYESEYKKVLIINNEAYWISDNAVYVADIIDGEPIDGSARKVDTIGMDDVQLKKIMFVVKTLTGE